MLRRGLLAECSYPIKDSSFIFENVYFLICLFFKSGGEGRLGGGGLALSAPPPALALVVSKLLELQCHWKVHNRTRRGPHKEALHNLSP